MSERQRGRWSENQLHAAMKAVGEGMSVKGASEMFRIPRRTLRNHLVTGSLQKKMGRPTYLTQEQEVELCSRIIRYADVGMPLTSSLLRRTVFTFCALNNIQHPFNMKQRMAGRKWLRLFLLRHENISKRRTQTLNPARAAKMNEFIVKDHFNKLHNVLRELDIESKPERIYNIDEKGCRLTLHHQQQVLAKKGSKNVHVVAPEHAENVTIVACGNAIGQVIPPMIIFKGQRLNQDWYSNLPVGSEICMSPKGSMTTAIFIRWLEHFSKYKSGGKCLLIFDGASSHLDANIVDVADKHNVVLYCLPSNTTHYLQPMDRSVFKSFESFWDDEVLRFWETQSERRITKITFGIIFSRVWPRALTQNNTISGFRATGIFPFNPAVIPLEAFAPSEVTRNLETSSRPENNGCASCGISDSSSEDTLSSTSDDSIHEQNDKTLSIQTATPSLAPQTPSSSGTRSTHSFSEILKTPEVRKTRMVRKKALNYRGQKISRELFKEAESKQQNKKKSNQLSNKSKTVDLNKPGISGTKKSKESWFCFICKKDRVLDMILCDFCFRYVHEKCVGITKDNRIERYECPECADDV